MRKLCANACYPSSNQGAARLTLDEPEGTVFRSILRGDGEDVIRADGAPLALLGESVRTRDE